MRFGPAFRVPPERSRTVTLVDLLFAALLTFVVIPAGLFFVGVGITLITEQLGVGRIIGELITGVGVLGLWAWVGVPAGIAVGWIATRTGWVGWAVAPLAGGLAGLITGATIILFEGDTLLANDWVFPLILILPGAVFGIMGWCALRYMRGDIYVGDVR